METNKTYNGWKNFQTWNVVLWLDNDEGLYNMVKYSDSESYEDFVHDYLLEFTQATPDGVGYLDPHIDQDALNAYIRENNGTDSTE
tara:strand:- start:1133 stop:1390 length:258 start_codon:yes stop_codon:yes gene_type:complete